jgi:hypothetical protein
VVCGRLPISRESTVCKERSITSNVISITITESSNFARLHKQPEDERFTYIHKNLILGKKSNC